MFRLGERVEDTHVAGWRKSNSFAYHVNGSVSQSLSARVNDKHAPPIDILPALPLYSIQHREASNSIQEFISLGTGLLLAINSSSPIDNVSLGSSLNQQWPRERIIILRGKGLS